MLDGWPVRRVAMIAMMLGVCACRQIAGIDDRAPSHDVADASDASPSLASLACGAMPGFAAGDSQECRSCLAGSCCGEITACNADPDCSAAVACMDACATSDDPKCAATCDTDHAASRPLFAAALACRVRSCADECGDAARCGRPPGPPDDCASCLDQSCCAEEQAGFSAAATRELQTCLAACDIDDFACNVQCFEAHLGALAPAAGMYACAQKSCSTSCPIPDGAECGIYSGLDGNPCGQCVAGSCCTQALACTEAPGCAALNDCLYVCLTSSACQESCYGKASVEDIALFNVVLNCRNVACVSECGAPATGVCGLTASPPACQDCMNQSCCDAGIAGATDLQSMSYVILSRALLDGAVPDRLRDPLSTRSRAADDARRMHHRPLRRHVLSDEPRRRNRLTAVTPPPGSEAAR